MVAPSRPTAAEAAGSRSTVSDTGAASGFAARAAVTSADTGLTRSTETDGDGVVIFSELPLGTYELVLSLPGFRTVTVKGVEVSASATTALPVKLDVAGVSVAEEVIARGGKVLLISDTEGIARLKGKATWTIEVPKVDAFVSPILYTIPVQLLAYHAAVIKGTDVDQPRNLAKSVTVE